MKKGINVLRLIIITVVVIVAAIVVVFVLGNEKVNYNELIEVKISRSGTMIPIGIEYSLELKNGTWVALRNEIGWVEDNVSEVTVDDVFVNNIKEILKENKVHKWDDFNIRNEISKRVGALITDGVNYSFYMQFSDGITTKYEEYNAYPGTFMTVLEEFENEFDALFSENE